MLREAGDHGASRPDGGRWRWTAARPARIGELAAEHQLVLHELSPQQASLEEAFMQLTAESVEYHAHAGASRPTQRAGSPAGRAPTGGAAGRRRADAWRRPRSSGRSGPRSARCASTVWTLRLAVVVTIALGMLICALSAHEFDNMRPQDRLSFDPTLHQLRRA